MNEMYVAAKLPAWIQNRGTHFVTQCISESLIQTVLVLKTLCVHLPVMSKRLLLDDHAECQLKLRK